MSEYRLADLACLQLSLISAVRGCVLILGVRCQQLRIVIVDHMMFLLPEVSVQCIPGLEFHVERAHLSSKVSSRSSTLSISSRLLAGLCEVGVPVAVGMSLTTSDSSPPATSLGSSGSKSARRFSPLAGSTSGLSVSVARGSSGASVAGLLRDAVAAVGAADDPR